MDKYEFKFKKLMLRLNQKEFAKILEVPVSKLQRYEQGLETIPKEVEIKLLHYIKFEGRDDVHGNNKVSIKR